jgi:riboflavin kinase
LSTEFSRAIELVGKVATGKGEARRYTRESWARTAFMEAVEIDPFPGTLNLKVPKGRGRNEWIACRRTTGILMPAPGAAFCDGRLFRVDVTSFGRRERGAVVVPMVPGYPEDLLEIIAAVELRPALRIRDGDELSVRIDLES